MKAIVVGGGIVGATVAHELAEKGAKVVLLEARYFTYGSTGRATGSITAQQRHVSLVERALETIRVWKEFRRRAEEMGIPFAQRFMADDSPHLAVAFNEEEYEELKKLAEVWKQGGAEVREVELEEARKLFPPLSRKVYPKVLVTPNDFKAMPHPYTWARVAAARLNGAETYTYEKVVKLEVGERVVALTESGKRFEGDVVIVAAGAASKKLVSMLGDSLSVDVKPMYAAGLVTEPFKYEIKASIRLHRYSLRLLQTVRNEYVVTIDNMGFENPDLSTEDSLEFLEKASTLTVKVAPVFAYVNVLRTWGGYIDVTADGLPIVGWSPKYQDKVYYVFGFNDYGLSVGPSVAVRAATEIAKGVRDPALDLYRPERRAV